MRLSSRGTETFQICSESLFGAAWTAMPTRHD
jgi:hypothetical protein